MNLILTCLQHNINFHIDDNSDKQTNSIGSIFNSNMVAFRRWELEMHYIINGEVPWNRSAYNAVTPNANLHTNIQCTEWPTESDLAAVLLAMGLGNLPVVWVWTPKTDQLGSRPVQESDPRHLGRLNLDPYPSTRGFCRVQLDPSVPISGFAFRDSLFIGCNPICYC